ncbi:uncharacterized protein FOMMEDRAFT_163129 [Fomitiporia mediterranea MF3/22]|uniref:Uncharacterized protein n=1 Tax=Fomitiporia mediterranea (strain MF3/22) TaxID=694068 RepID=R7SIP9_FOMME|nr:uncharacterized protein FOMMEDRAFT_163129 [Fomitiporia mediterranea MF3/22]EJC97484.1 hypothetical protein FOMMEDRAFT_163129 [Fomitiporia mediterranea MF3/22]
MQKQRVNTQVTSVEATTNGGASLIRTRYSRDFQTINFESTAIFSNEAEGSANVHGNAFSTTTGSHGALQAFTTREDQSASTGSTSSNPKTAQAAHVVEKKRKRNAEVLDSRPQASGSSTESPQNSREDLPNASFPLPPRLKARKKRGHGWTRRKIRRATTQDRTVRVGGKRPVEGVDGEEDEARRMKRQRISEEAVAGSSNARSMSLDNMIGATNVRQLRSRSIVFPDGPANSGSDEGNRTTRSPSPDRAPVRSTIDDSLAIAVEFVQIKMEEEEEDYLWDTPPAWDWSPVMPESELTNEDTFKFDSNRSTPELSTEHSECHISKSESVGSTPISTPRAQSEDVQSFDRSLVIVLPGTMEEEEAPDELMDVLDEGEDEDEIDEYVSGSFILGGGRRSRAPSPPSLPPSHSVSRLSTLHRDEETESARYRPEENAYDQEIIPHLDYGYELQSQPARPPGFLSERLLPAIYCLSNAIRHLSESSEVHISNPTVSSDAMAS